MIVIWLSLQRLVLITALSHCFYHILILEQSSTFNWFRRNFAEISAPVQIEKSCFGWRLTWGHWLFCCRSLGEDIDFSNGQVVCRSFAIEQHHWRCTSLCKYQNGRCNHPLKSCTLFRYHQMHHSSQLHLSPAKMTCRCKHLFVPEFAPRSFEKRPLSLAGNPHVRFCILVFAIEYTYPCVQSAAPPLDDISIGRVHTAHVRAKLFKPEHWSFSRAGLVF